MQNLKYQNKKKLGQALRYDSGQAMLTVVTLFLFLSMMVVMGISDPVLRQAKITKDFLDSRKSYFLAESGVEDVVYRVKKNKQVPASGTLVLDGNTVTVSVQDTPGTKTISTSADSKNLIRRVDTVLKTGTGSSFNYGVLSGQGGFVLGTNATINGSIYSNGSVTGSSGSSITGSAISANSSALVTDQKNDSPLPPPNSINFGDSSSRQDFGQGFKLATLGPLTKVSLYIKKVSTPSNLTVRIVTNSSGNPGTNTVVSGTLSSALVTSSYGWVDVSFVNYVELTPGVTYWLVLDGSNSSTKYYVLGANTSYPNGDARLGQYGGSWSATNPTNLDSYFKIYLGGLNGLIDGVSVGSAGVGNAEAYQVKNSTIAGSLYCQIGSDNNKACDTSKTVPVELGLPVSDGNILQWQSDALAGGVINGNYTVSSSVSLGPKKIVGNLTIDGNKTLTLTGTIWVTGKIEIENGAKVKLDSSYGSNSGLLMSDNIVDISNNSTFSGSGQSGSYIMVLTTSDCPISSYCSGSAAMDISNNVGAAILNAEKGTIHINNNGVAEQLTAYKIILDNGAVINYEQGIAHTNFSSGPTGGWTIQEWKEVE